MFICLHTHGSKIPYIYAVVKVLHKEQGDLDSSPLNHEITLGNFGLVTVSQPKTGRKSIMDTALSSCTQKKGQDINL